MKHALLLLVLISTTSAFADTVFVEAETFTSSSDGWRVAKNSQTRSASRTQTIHGAAGDMNGVASKTVTVSEAGRYRVWVRYLHHTRFRGPFEMVVRHEGKSVAAKEFDRQPLAGKQDWECVWDYVDAELSSGKVVVDFSKSEQKNCVSYVRHIDCVLLTSDKTLIPNHLPYGPQTYLRVTLGNIYERPVHVHVFADHYRSPWYQHFHLSKAGANPGLYPNKNDLLLGGDQTPWCNITPMLYQDSGAILNINTRHTYHERASRLQAKFEFATAADEAAIVRTMEITSEQNGLVVVVPPDLTTAKNLSRLKRDADFAEATGKIADAYDWPTIGRKPERFPFFVSARVGGYGTDVDQAVSNREWKTLDYFGFANRRKSIIHGAWHMKEKSFCRPDVERMKEYTAIKVQEFLDSGESISDIEFCMLTDEPTGQPSAFAAQDEAYHEAFRAWLKQLGKSPADLLAENWNAVKPVPETQRDKFPALHYFTQRFRTRALGDFMATQRGVLEEAYGRSFPTMVNFSDGATYSANFYNQGVDYFELLDADDQNAIWSEDWANGASSYQCGAYNVDLMRAAARERKQTIGHYLIAHAGRKPWDIKLKAASETARGVRMWQNFSYGVAWGNHEGGPTWKNHAWYSKPETWQANAEIVREIGGSEDLLLAATADPAEVAILYSSSSDAWMLNRNYAFGFNRMHTWMALAHAQVPVDFVAERQVERDALKNYKVCYLSGPNLTRAAAQKLSEWVAAGGVLYLSAGAASMDEFNRPLEILNPQLPADRGPLETLQPYLNSGSYVHVLQAKDHAVADDVTMEVLSVRQQQTPRPGADVLARFSDGSAALVRTQAGRGTIYSAGFLPALDYIKQAVVARRTLQAAKVTADELATNQTAVPTPAIELSDKSPAALSDVRLARSYNPWEFSAAVREQILQPVRAAGINPPLTCNVPLVDAVLLQAEHGAVIPIANYTLAPLENVAFQLRTQRPIENVESTYHGFLKVEAVDDDIVRFSMPLEASDYVRITYE